jgi:hypothetical protein
MEPFKNKNGRLITFDYSKLFMGFTRSDIGILKDALRNDFNSLVASNQDFKDHIEFYEFYKSKMEELDFREKFTYTLSVVKNRESSPTILAKVKWLYKLNGKLSKSKYTSVHICSIKKYFKDIENIDLKNPTLIIDAENKIWEYLKKTSPIELNKITGEKYTL